MKVHSLGLCSFLYLLMTLLPDAQDNQEEGISSIEVVSWGYGAAGTSGQ